MTSRNWNSLPASIFPNTYNLQNPGSQTPMPPPSHLINFPFSSVMQGSFEIHRGCIILVRPFLHSISLKKKRSIPIHKLARSREIDEIERQQPAMHITRILGARTTLQEELEKALRACKRTFLHVSTSTDSLESLIKKEMDLYGCGEQRVNF